MHCRMDWNRANRLDCSASTAAGASPHSVIHTSASARSGCSSATCASSRARPSELSGT